MHLRRLQALSFLEGHSFSPIRVESPFECFFGIFLPLHVPLIYEESLTSLAGPETPMKHGFEIRDG